MRKKATISLIITILFIITVAAGIIIYKNSAPVKLKEKLDLGNKHLQEEDYEQAVAEYSVAIDIDPASVDAYIGLAKAYVGMGDLDKASESLDKGIKATGSNELKTQKEEIDKQIAEEQARREAEEKARLEAEEKARKEQEEAERKQRQAETLEADLDAIYNDDYFTIGGARWDGKTSLYDYRNIINEKWERSKQSYTESWYVLSNYREKYSIFTNKDDKYEEQYLYYYGSGNDYKGWINTIGYSVIVQWHNIDRKFSIDDVTTIEGLSERWGIENQNKVYQFDTNRFGNCNCTLAPSGDGRIIIWIDFEKNGYFYGKKGSFVITADQSGKIIQVQYGEDIK